MSWLQNSGLTATQRPDNCAICKGPVIIVTNPEGEIIGSPCHCSDPLEFHAAARLPPRRD